MKLTSQIYQFILSLMERIIETERLFLREFKLIDAPALFKLNDNPIVMKYTGDAPFKNIQAAEEFVKNYTHYQVYNMGRWAVCSKKNGEFLGWCGLKYHPNKDIVEVGYRFLEKHWNKGYATEATKGALSYGFNVLKIQDIYAFVNTENNASKKVAEKAGLLFLKEIIHEGNHTNLYHLKNSLIEVKEITASETHSIRHKVLRQGKPIESCVFEGDTLKTTIHLGLFYYGELIGVATYLKNNTLLIKDSQQFQLRGMAILQQFQGKQLGNVLLKKGELILKQKNVALIWCNARALAKSFYLKYGFNEIGKPFDILDIGKHFVMFKKL